MGEHLVCTEKVVGSIPILSTNGRSEIYGLIFECRLWSAANLVRGYMTMPSPGNVRGLVTRISTHRMKQPLAGIALQVVFGLRFLCVPLVARVGKLVVLHTQPCMRIGKACGRARGSQGCG